MYYVRCVTRSIIVGQVSLLSLFSAMFICNGDVEIIDEIANRCIPIYLIYTFTVVIVFLPYMLPNWEIKSLVTVLLFGPLTLIQPLVIILGMIYALSFEDNILQPEIILVIIGTLFCLFFEKFLDTVGWSRKDAKI